MLAGPIHHCPLRPLHPLPRLTQGLPGTGGQIRTQVEDFQVEELPLYLPAGEGDHLYLWIEKTDVAADALRRTIARCLDVGPGEVGMAGLKDRRAITRQWVSVPRRAEPLLGKVDGPRIRVLDVKAHRNKLRTGHLAGNRFRILLRGVSEDAAQRAADKVALLQAIGMPNFYGTQRMGHGGATLAAGWALGQGLHGLVQVRLPDDTEHALHLRDRSLQRLAASALQSEVFNRTLAERMRRGLHDRVLLGDLCRKTDTGGQFATDDVERESQRLQAGQIELTGPMWGPKMPRPAADALQFELDVLQGCELDPSIFVRLGALAEGTRRALLVKPAELSATLTDQGLWLEFTLPAGAFATVLVGEVAGPLLGAEAVNFEAGDDDDPTVRNLEYAEAQQPCA